eukprot:2573929-Amphidinium_carterae.1
MYVAGTIKCCQRSWMRKQHAFRKRKEETTSISLSFRRKTTQLFKKGTSGESLPGRLSGLTCALQATAAIRGHFKMFHAIAVGLD